MGAMNDPNVVARQYANADGLTVRTSLHQKYSVNKEPYFDWVSKHYCIRHGMRVLELGCGTGAMWANPDRWLPAEAELVLTDLSEGMLETAKRTVPKRANISFALADIQALPYANQSFDLVIANAMLYHVPDLQRALGEVARVLKTEGRFLCTTTGDNGMHAWFQRVLGRGDSPSLSFSLQNGCKLLSPHFGQIERIDRKDWLEVTDVEDLCTYVRSTLSFAYVKAWPEAELKAKLTAERVDGVIRIPKANGIFQCYEPIVTKIFD